jgi:hypothetical protein
MLMAVESDCCHTMAANSRAVPSMKAFHGRWEAMWRMPEDRIMTHKPIPSENRDQIDYDVNMNSSWFWVIFPNQAFISTQDSLKSQFSSGYLLFINPSPWECDVPCHQVLNKFNCLKCPTKCWNGGSKVSQPTYCITLQFKV